MARTVRVGDFQAMQRAGSKGPNHTALGESEALGDRETGRHDVATMDPMTGSVIDAAPIEPAAEDLADPLADLLHGETDADYPTESDIPCDECGGVVMLNSAEEDRRLASRVAEGVEIEVLCDGCAAKSDPGPGSTMAERLEALNVEAGCSAEMSRSLVVGRVREASFGMDPAPAEEDIQDEATRIWLNFGDQRKGPVERKPEDRAKPEACSHAVIGLHGICTACGEYVGDGLDERVSGRAEQLAGQLGRGRVFDVAPDGIVEGVRPADMTPDRGPEVGTTHHQVTDPFDSQARSGQAEPRFSGSGADVQPELLFSIPSAAKFGTAPYLDAPSLEEMATRLIREKDQLAELDGLRIVYRWKAKGGNQKGWPRLGGIERVSGQTLAFIAGPAPDLLVWLAADTLRDSAVTEIQVEAMLFDQLASVEWSDGDEDGDPTWRLVGPEIMCHLSTLEEYGPFTRKLQAAKPAFSQPGLFDMVADLAVDDELDDEEQPADPDQPYDDEEPDTSDELPTGEEIDAAMTDRGLV